MNSLMLAIVASAGLGAVIGLIRQWSEQAQDPQAEEFSGVRTFTFWGVLGCVAAFLTDRYAAAVLPVVVAVVGVHFALRARPRPGVAAGGSTTFAAALLTLAVGALVQWQHRKEAVLVSGLAVVLLGLKRPIHAWTRAFTEVDIRATLQFVAITGVILPLVPDRSFGPYGAFNPFNTWLMVVLISGVGFAGYVAMRLLDARAGIALTSLLGGLASSTATTLAFSRRSREDPAQSVHYAMAVGIACTVMLPRVLIVLGLISPALSARLVVPFALMAGPGVAYGLWTWWRLRARACTPEQPAITNPLSLLTAIKFALIYAAITLLVKAAAELGYIAHGLLPLAFVSGLSDVDAVALSVAGNLSTGAILPALAAQAVVVAAISNSILKAGLAVAFGSPVLRRHVLLLMLFIIAAGLAGVALLR
ncbi:MAG: MgtC/SapB family protein [Opitutaceae bacterium]|nr:MgtC/SapB family protein [Opitutaceae bacterium]